MEPTQPTSPQASGLTGGEPILVTDPFAVSVCRDYIRPAADQWARSSRTAAELEKRDSAKSIAEKLQALIAIHGPDALISDGRNDVTLADALAILVVGKVVGGYIAAPDQRMGGAIPADAIFRVAASSY